MADYLDIAEEFAFTEEELKEFGPDCKLAEIQGHKLSISDYKKTINAQ